MMGNYYLLNPSKRWAAVCIAKNACTSLKRDALLSDGHTALTHRQVHNRIGYDGSSTHLHAVASGRPKDLYCFAVWRDPVRRFLSAYRHFSNQDHGSPLTQIGPRLDTWIKQAEKELLKPPLQQDEHLRRQSDFYKRDDVDAIVSIEDLTDWFYGRGWGSLPHSNESRPALDSPSPEQIERIRQLYAPDYEIAPTVTLPTGKQRVFGFWHGDKLGTLPELTIRSHLDCGFDFTLLSYNRFDNLPEGADSLDANEFVPLSEDTPHRSGSLAPLGDWVRYEYLSKAGGTWVDMDFACLSPFRLADEPWFCRQSSNQAGLALVSMPREHVLTQHLAELAADPAVPMPWDTPEVVAAKLRQRADHRDRKTRRALAPWGHAGPQALSDALKHYGIFHLAAPTKANYPVPWSVWRHCYDGSARLFSEETHDSLGVHLWNEMVRLEPDSLEKLHPHSIVSSLVRRHSEKRRTLPWLSSEKKVPTSAAKDSSHSPKVLVGVCSCRSAEKRQDAVRSTWMAPDIPNLQTMIFVGGHGKIENLARDTIHVDTPDDYESLPAKVLAFFKTALERFDFDWLFKCDDDSYVATDRLHSLIDDRFDLIGDRLILDRGAPSGGAGYLLSRDLVERLVADPTLPERGVEDLIIGWAASSMGARIKTSQRLRLDASDFPKQSNDVVTAHWCKPERLRAIHAVYSDTPTREVDVRHRDWSDTLYFYGNGFFARKSTSCMGRWRDVDAGWEIDWFDWGTEIVVPDRAKGGIISTQVGNTYQGDEPETQRPPSTRLYQSAADRIGLWIEILNQSRPKRVAEVGVWNGDYAAAILKHCPSIEEYYMIDPWRNLDNWNKPFNVTDEEFQQHYESAMKATEFAATRRKVLRGTTTEVADLIPDDHLDFIYLDGDHTLRGITLDLISLYPKLTENGMIGGDDFHTEAWQHPKQFEPTLVFPFAVYFAEAINRPIRPLPFSQFLIENAGGRFEDSSDHDVIRNLGIQDCFAQALDPMPK